MNGGGIDPSISPGIGGFLAFFLLACALWLLMRNMIGHLRKVEYREELEAAEAAEAEQSRDGGVVSRPTSVAAAVPHDSGSVRAGGTTRANDGTSSASSGPEAAGDPAASLDRD